MNSRRFMMILYVAFVSVLGGHSAQATQGFDTFRTCDSYAVLAQNMNCGPQSYIEKFALPYCQRYLKNDGSFSPQAQNVLANIRSCLQQTLIEVAEAGKLTCQNVQDIGLNSHYDCYIQSGFCSLPSEDVRKVMWVAKAEVFNRPVMEIFGRVIETCARHQLVSK